MSKLIGNIDYVPQPGYPRYEGESGQDGITLQYIMPLDSVEVPEYRTAFYDARFAFFNRFTHLGLSSINVEPIKGLGARVTLEYSRSNPSDSANVEESIECNNVELETAISKHPNYKTCWNHDLLIKDGEGSTWPEYDQATDTKIPSQYVHALKWSRHGDPVPEGWSVTYTAAKPGTESFVTYVPEVQVVKYARNKASLLKTMDKDGTPQTPPDTFNRSGAWLQSGSTIKEEGKGWVLRTSYINSRTIDSDIYPVPEP